MLMKKILTYAIFTLLLLTACHDYEQSEADNLSERTVLVYMSGENDLSDNVANDINEMLQAKTHNRNHCLLVYVDESNSRRVPFLARVQNGHLVDSVSIKNMDIKVHDTCSVDPGVMKTIISYAFNKYKSRNNDYGLVLWGHASGWVLDDSVSTASSRQTSQRRAYGYDSGRDNGGKAAWINMHTLAEVLSQGPHLKFIFADCCHFQALESAYTLRNVTDYIIGSPAEIPAKGAPYNTVVPALFEPDTFYTAIIDRYYEQVLSNNRRVPLSAIKTSALEHLAKATGDVLLSMKDTLQHTSYPNLNGLIHYYNRPLFNDANDFILRYAKPEAYATWKQALDSAVVYKKMATRWVTNVEWDYNYTDFEITEQRYGGVSMFIPQDPIRRGGYSKYNNDIKNTAWYQAAGLSLLGW